jgi:hypothetical protein
MPYTLDLLCYRLAARVDYDEEVIWAYVQRSGGEMIIHRDCIDFFVPLRAVTVMLCAWPELELVAAESVAPLPLRGSGIGAA